MNRKSFLTKLGIGTAAVVMVPMVLAEDPKYVVVDLDEKTSKLIEKKEKQPGLREWGFADSDEIEKKISKIFDKDPDLTGLIKDISKGMPYRDALNKHYDIKYIKRFTGIYSS